MSTTTFPTPTNTNGLLVRATRLGLRLLLLAAATATAYLCLTVPKSSFLPREPSFIPGVVDFGMVGQNQTLTTKVKFHNSLRSPITIEHINKSCACLAASINKSVIPPGGDADLELDWETRAHEFATQDKLAIFFKSDDFNGSRSAELTINAKVTPGYTLRPAELTFTTKNGIRTAHVNLKNYADSAEIQEVLISKDYLTATIAPDRRSFDLRFQPREFAEDTFVVPVQVKTNSTRIPRKTIAVKIVK